MGNIPDSCIRGPDLDDQAAIDRHIRDLPAAALETYEAGLATIRAVWNMGRLEEQVAVWKQERRFLIGQLRQVERQYPEVVAGAVTAGARAPAAPDGPTATAGAEPCVS